MKKVISVILTLTLMLSLLTWLPGNVFAVTSGQCGDDITWEVSNRGKNLTLTGVGSVYDLGEYSPLESPYPWEDHVDTITDVTVGEGITSIGRLSLAFLPELRSVSLPSTLESIGEAAFWNDNNLQSITIPYGVTSIGDCAFMDCKNLATARIPVTVTSIPEGAFAYCDNLQKVYIPASITSIGDDAFQSCYWGLNIYYSGSEISWARISMGRGNDILEWDAYIFYNYGKAGDNLNWSIIGGTLIINGTGPMYNFWPSGSYAVPWEDYASDLTSVVIGEGVTSVGDQAFFGYENIRSASLPDSLTKIGDCAFEGCTSLSSVNIPDSVTDLGFCAFRDCAMLTGADIPSGISTVKSETFAGCTGMTLVTIPSSVRSIYTGAFDNCGMLSDIYYDGTAAGWRAITVEEYNDALSSATVHYNSSGISINYVDLEGFIKPVTGMSSDDVTAPLCIDNYHPHCRFADYYWIDTSTGSALSGSDLFIAGHSYRLYIKLAPDSGYFFNPDGVDITLVGGLEPDNSLSGISGNYYEVYSQVYTPQTRLSEINLTGFVNPVAGKTVSEISAGISVPQGAHYRIYTDYVWFDVTDYDYMGPDDVFIVGHEYIFTVNMAVNDGYSFYCAEPLLSGRDVYLDFGETYVYNDNYAKIQTVCLIPDVPTVKTVEIFGFLPPRIGQTAGEQLANITVPANAEFSVDEMFWHDGTEECNIGPDDVFIAGHIYYLCIFCSSAEGYIFSGADFPAIYFDRSHTYVDTRFSAVVNNSTFKLYSIDMEPLPSVLTEVNIEGFEVPTAGKTAGELTDKITVPAGSPYQIMSARWHDATANRAMLPRDVFNDTSEYYLQITVIAVGGYEFRSGVNIPVYFNGETTYVDTSANFAYSDANSNYRIYSVNVNALPAPVTVLPGDVNGDGRVTSADSKMLKQFFAGELPDGTINEANADVNGDGRLTSADSKALKLMMV